MTHREHPTAYHDLMELLIQHGPDATGEAMTTLLNHAMRIERERALGVAPHQRSDERRGYANGFKPKTLHTRSGEITLAVPQTREYRGEDGKPFYPSALQRGVRSERALTLAVAEMYVQGVSTRKVNKVVERLCGLEITSAEVSRAASELDQQLEAWRNRPIGQIVYLILDARYEKVRHGGSVVPCALLTAIGVGPDGRRAILGASAALSEAEVHWRGFLESLQRRGMHGVKLIVSDDHSGLKQAREATFAGVPWQRCQFHLMQNAMAYVPRQEIKSQAADDLRRVFHAEDREQADHRLRQAVEKYQTTAPRLAAWIEDNAPEGLTILNFPQAHRKRLRTTNGIERLNREIRRRTRVATLFPHEHSMLRLASATLSEISDEWETNRPYLNMEAT